MTDFRAQPSDRFLSVAVSPRSQSRRVAQKASAEFRVLTLAAIAALLGAALAVYPSAQTQARPLTITAKPRVALSAQDRAALGAFAAAPGLTPVAGLKIDRAFGEDDEDCLRVGQALVCRR